MTKLQQARCLLAVFIIGTLALKPLKAEPLTSTEEKFQDIFVTAGYATAFGAALGAASLSFYENPSEHLQMVAIGASLGFIGGSIFGTYIVFSPAAQFAQNRQDIQTPLAVGQDSNRLHPRNGLILRPHLTQFTDNHEIELTAFEAGWTFLQF